MNPSNRASQLTVDEHLANASRVLREAGFPSPRDEAMAILGDLAGVDRGEVWLRRFEPWPDDVLRGFIQAVGRRAEGWPRAYATGRSGFRHLNLHVDDRVLIPRPETEGLVQHVLDRKAARRFESVLDIGTGSGCVLLSLAVESDWDSLVGVDQSAGAVEIADLNRRRIAPDAPIELFHGDLFQPVEGRRFDVIVSNPPYVAGEEHETLDCSVREFEPRAALVSPRRGMAHIEAICRGAPSHLHPGGLLAIEVDSRRADDAMNAALEAGFADPEVVQDIFGRNRYLLCEKAPA